jgi:Zn-dependent M28 family amino/carboxypeptidase
MKLSIRVITALFLFTLLSCSTVKIPGGDPLGGLTSDVSALAADYMEGRETGTPGEAKAAEYIIKRYKELDLLPKGDNNTYKQEYVRKIKSNPHADAPAPDDPEIRGNNIIGYIDNKAAKTVILGAHYDHLGYGGEGSLYIGPAEIHNGADDNSSGVAAMLYLAKILKGNKKTDHYNYLFIGFSGEEKGLWGSNYFANNPTIDLRNVAYMFNMDMVGRLNEDRKLAVGGVGTSSIWSDITDKANKDLKLTKTESGIGPSDHTSFYLKDIPVLFFFTGQHKDYHKPSDDIQFVNFQGLRDVAQYIYRIIYKTQKIKNIDFQKTKDETRESPRFNITLGVMPDYLYDGKGMRIDGIREGKVADKYEFKAGDIILKMGEMEVFDMKSYMKALSKYHPGDSIDILFLRDDKEMAKKVTF